MKQGIKMDKDEKIIIDNYLTNKTSGDQIENTLILLSEPENKEILNKFWEKSSQKVKNSGINKKDLLGKIHQEIIIRDKKQNGKKRTLYYLTRIAAVLFIPLFVYVAWDITSGHKKYDQTQYAEIVSQAGVKTSLNLPDGTKVWLNNFTKLRYPTEFSGKTREVFVDGEAYFEVKKDASMPFIVNTSSIGVKVLGTSFNVEAFAEDNFTEISLLEGKVALQQEIQGKNTKQLTTLIPGETANYNKSVKKLNIRKDNIERQIAWKDGKLVLENCLMEQAAVKMSRWYNCDIVISDERLKEFDLNAIYEGENLEQALHLMALAMPVEYEIIPARKLSNNSFTKRKVIFKMKKK